MGNWKTDAKILKISIPLALLSLTAVVPAVAQNFDEVEVESQKVAEGVYVLTGAGGNIGVSVGDDGVILIDDQFAPLTDKVKAAVGKISDKPIRFVLNTHWHRDHTGGNEKLGEAGALIVAHDNVRERMSAEQLIEAFGTRVPPSPEGALPVVTFNDTATFHYNGEDIHVFHVTSAHTDGDSIVHFRRANALHMGDAFFNGKYPFIDVSTGGSLEGMIAAADAVLPLIDDETKIIVGHGPVASRDDLVAFQEMLKTVRDRIAPLVEAGQTLEEVVAAQPTKDFDEKWGKSGINGETFVSIVYSSLSK
jgi:glyoxylase-like metal-dependent hydrolase (beta-lactamase superfamily II)